MKMLTKLVKTLRGILACGAIFSAVSAGQGAIHEISITADGFVPAYLEVVVGDRVYWWNDDFDYYDSHSTRSYSYPWNSGPIPVGFGVYLDTTQTGFFEYLDDWGYCGFGTLVIVANTPPPPPVLTEALRLANGSFQCTITNLTPGKTFCVEASTNLVDWAQIYTGTASSAAETYVDALAATLGKRFYRALTIP